MPPQLKTIAILALDDAIIRLTQAKTSLTEAHSFLIFFLLSFIPYDTSAGAEIQPRHCEPTMPWWNFSSCWSAMRMKLRSKKVRSLTFWNLGFSWRAQTCHLLSSESLWALPRWVLLLRKLLRQLLLRQLFPRVLPWLTWRRLKTLLSLELLSENRLSHKSLRFEISVDFLNMHLEQSMQLEDQSNPCS